MSHITDDPNHPGLTRGPDTEPTPQADTYLVLPEPDRAKPPGRPYRERYTHDACGGETRISRPIAETYAQNPSFYGSTYCVHCRMHRPVSEFRWLDGEVVGS